MSRARIGPPRFPRIREYRMEHDMSVPDLLDALDNVISQNMYFVYQRGEVDPPFRFILAVLQLTGLPFSVAFEEGRVKRDQR